jgi:hypothetical protein
MLYWHPYIRKIIISSNFRKKSLDYTSLGGMDLKNKVNHRRHVNKNIDMKILKPTLSLPSLYTFIYTLILACFITHK